MRAFVGLFVLLTAGGAYAGDATTAFYPTKSLTPGATNPKLTPKYLCSHPTSDRRLVPLALRKAVFAVYNVPYADRAKYEVDHFIPLALGGVNTCKDNPTCNLWPQPHQKQNPGVAPWGSETKDKLEARLYHTMCKKGRAVKDANWLRDAQAGMMGDWRGQYAKNFGEIVAKK